MKIFLLFLFLFTVSCSKKQNDRTSKASDDSIIVDNSINLSTNIENNTENESNIDIMEEINKRVEYNNVITSLPKIFSEWKNENYVELPNCPKTANREEFLQLFNMIFHDAPLNEDTYPYLMNFLEQFSSNCNSESEKVSVYAAMGRAANYLMDYNNSTSYYLKAAYHKLDETSSDYEEMREFQLLCLAGGLRHAMLKTYDTNYAKFEKEILKSKNVHTHKQYYNTIYQIYRCTYNYEKAARIAEDVFIKKFNYESLDLDYSTNKNTIDSYSDYAKNWKENLEKEKKSNLEELKKNPISIFGNEVN